MSGTSLVHPRTAHLPPDEQAKGTYVLTTPEELSARAALERAGSPTGRTQNTHPEPHSLPVTGRVVRKPPMNQLVDTDYASLECRMAVHILSRNPEGVFVRMSTSGKESVFEKLAADLGYNIE
ncbi:hypothetical protein [Aeromonas phage 25AhydR2PP]|uniref:Uncharacterized protein n=1 Tax=Aeromonas phage 25AhydR2PP TaxID=2163976 RepID=A0A3G6V762_9CAUD|nr:hypothetical protein HOT20_gp40 [Aeromonas phage 25AhydR2PP]AZB48861.1 hypothetical protein [Aeromonas phage 25AhydR2PP]